jgi:hypothetical protein
VQTCTFTADVSVSGQGDEATTLKLVNLTGTVLESDSFNPPGGVPPYSSNLTVTTGLPGTCYTFVVELLGPSGSVLASSQSGQAAYQANNWTTGDIFYWLTQLPDTSTFKMSTNETVFGVTFDNGLSEMYFVVSVVAGGFFGVAIVFAIFQMLLGNFGLGLYYGLQTVFLEVGLAYVLAVYGVRRRGLKSSDGVGYGLSLAFWENGVLIVAWRALKQTDTLSATPPL